jgi:hypothetical protein
MQNHGARRHSGKSTGNLFCWTHRLGIPGIRSCSLNVKPVGQIRTDLLTRGLSNKRLLRLQIRKALHARVRLLCDRLWNMSYWDPGYVVILIFRTSSQIQNPPRTVGQLHCEGVEKNPWPYSASELYRPSQRHLSAKLVPTFAYRQCHVVNVTDPYGRILGFLDWSCYFCFQVAPQLYSRG